MPGPLRVVSLLPSATEIVCALGAAEELVGVSHECDFPEHVRGLPVVTGSRVEDTGSSRGIDDAVRAVVESALSVYAVDDALLGSLAPDLVITQDLCEVCAVSLDDVRAAVARLAQGDDVRIVSLRPTRLGDIFEDVVRVADALDRRAAGEELHVNLRARMETITHRASTSATRPRVASLEWIDPIMLGGTWMPEVIEAAGGMAIGSVAGGPAPTVTPETLAALHPDVVVIKACGFSLERTLRELDALERDALGQLPSTTRVYATDGNAFFNRPGPRIVESIEIMASCVHPVVFSDFAERHAAVVERLR
ncbi:MAG: ABC transporter substrate-binding protein [Polyangiales bacterium]